MQCKDVEFVVEQEGLGPLPEAARVHVAACSHCQEFFTDLATIASVANQLPAEVEPPARLWNSLRAQLELEGIIKTPLVSAGNERSSWWHGFGELFRSRALATVTVGLVIVAAGFLQLRQPPVSGPEPNGFGDGPASQIAFTQTAKVLSDQEIDLRNMHLADTSPVDSSFRRNPQQVDEFIADCERHLKAEPQDELARECLSNAYQQKAELLSAMMDREGSLH
jgi:hypothetical protein